MPEKVKKGVGMMEHTALHYDMTSAGSEKEWQACLDHLMATMKGPDEVRDHNAQMFRDVLESCGLPEPGLATLNLDIYRKLGEDSPQYISAQWLMEYHRLGRAREKLLNTVGPSDVKLLIMHAEEVGRLRERAFWRNGLDEATGKRREALGLSGRRQVKNGQVGNSMRTHNSFVEKDGSQAQKFVDELHQRNPHLSWADMQKKAAKKFGVSQITIRRNLENPKKAGSGRSE